MQFQKCSWYQEFGILPELDKSCQIEFPGSYALTGQLESTKLCPSIMDQLWYVG